MAKRVLFESHGVAGALIAGLVNLQWQTPFNQMQQALESSLQLFPRSEEQPLQAEAFSSACPACTSPPRPPARLLRLASSPALRCEIIATDLWWRCTGNGGGNGRGCHDGGSSHSSRSSSGDDSGSSSSGGSSSGGGSSSSSTGSGSGSGGASGGASDGSGDGSGNGASGASGGSSGTCSSSSSRRRRR
eukprot:CAMPEP_0197638864 /NCGR_PEP_ID=MMETSP1338-20131121/13666_1 /TAXON_ID=43686 ORGANISM="Pelagodinium beii, Strain RCC1491" /NCGR_SAMPLE_ID=MMETSP1338 /ASSEMBLY_ACC=CAM_ASM_000754 /LENGTH=188 /DNA_ID=CAMNT_0043211517 /DNA_START=128 /DNA_END=691 /DNA_ORIENTATION=-